MLPAGDEELLTAVQSLIVELVATLELGLERELAAQGMVSAALARDGDIEGALQQSGRNWLSLGTTKTGLVYRKGNPPQSHE